MAVAHTSIKKYWPILLLAAAVAERAHAPMIHGAHASNGKDNGANFSAPSVHSPPDQKQKAGPDLLIPPTSDPIDPEAIKQKLSEINRGRYVKPQWPWDLSPLDPTPDPSPYEIPAKNTVALIPTVDPDSWSDIINSSDITGGGGGGGGQSGPGYTQPPDSIVYNPSSGGGGGGEIVIPQNLIAITNLPDPRAQPTVAVTGLAPVPEPAMTSVLLAGWMLARRPRGRRDTTLREE